MSDIYHSIYMRLEKIGVLDVKQYAVIENSPYEPLCIDRLSEDMIAISQNPVIDGALVADPDIEIKIDPVKKTAEPLVYQDRSGRKVVYPKPDIVDLGIKNELMEFLDRWLDDLIKKGFIRNQ